MTAEPRVLVVGAGPTGLLLSAELHRRGIACLTIDAHAGPLHWDRATVIHPRSLEVFESLGLVEQVLDTGVRQRVIRIHSQGARLGEIDLSLCGSRYGFNVGMSEEVTESILTEYLHRQGGEIQRSSRLTGLEQTPDKLVATIQRDESEETVAVEWVVGCDGYHSTARQLCGIELVGHDIEAPWAVFDATLAGWPESYEANYVYLDEILVALTALPHQRWRVYLRPRSPDSDLVGETAAIVARYHPGLRIEGVNDPTRFQCHSRVAARFRSGRVLLAGDAAHVCSPAEGHGMNSGLQDAFNLAWKLALVCQGQCHADLLNSYEAERRPVAQCIADSGDDAERMEIIPDAAARDHRDEALRTVFADPERRYEQIVAEAELAIDYGDSPIVMGTTTAAPAPGQRLPDTFEIHVDGRSGRLHELAHRSGQTALLIGMPSAAARLAELGGTIQSRIGDTPIDACLVLQSQADSPQSGGWLSPTAAAELEIEEITLFVIRPDGHVGLRADTDHVASLDAYLALLQRGRS